MNNPASTLQVVSKMFTFSASHRLTGLPEGHKCLRLHGHNYEVILTMAGYPNGTGMVLDYGLMKPFGQWLTDNWDHRHLGDGDVYDQFGALTDPSVFNYAFDGGPTAENLAYVLFGVAHGLFDLTAADVTSVEVRETDGTSATALAMTP
jgi:6-pyruvoyl-tetrahydropterin synthase